MERERLESRLVTVKHSTLDAPGVEKLTSGLQHLLSLGRLHQPLQKHLPSRRTPKINKLLDFLRLRPLRKLSPNLKAARQMLIKLDERSSFASVNMATRLRLEVTSEKEGSDEELKHIRKCVEQIFLTREVLENQFFYIGMTKTL